MTLTKTYSLLVILCSVFISGGIYVLKANEEPDARLSKPVVDSPNSISYGQSKHRTPNVNNGTDADSSSSSSNCSNILSPGLIEEIRGYKKTVDQIINYITRGEYKGKAYDFLAALVDTYGPRITGSGMLEAAIDHMLEASRAEGLENVRTEDVVVPHWERNNESAWMVLPRLHKLNFLGLGSSVGTPREGIKAPALVVKDFQELEENAHLAKGKIVVYNPEWVSYGDTVQYRTAGASKAAEVGAVASLTRSVTPFSIDSPHTGQQFYSSEVKIPTGCITVEDAAMLARMQERGETIEILLKMGAVNYPDTTSRNTIAEVTGSESPQEVVVVSGHLDSWDVGQGAMDDGGGVTISWNAAVVLRKLGLRPRRTLRVILWTGEEQGLIGGQAYYHQHVADKDNYQMLMESDIGTFNPLGLAFSGNEEATCIIQEIMSLLEPLNTTKIVSPMDGGPDIEIWSKAGVPTGSLYNANSNYYWFHHSDGDTMSVEDPDTLDRCLALWTSVAYVTADISRRLPHESAHDEL
ncbi:carboxypeptidase Q-like [Macrobrachium nipponense]|uniref:carboxypeptidase Q-like n=1 Tax=Macrobrachium nipponense TaxID=159736 RepID=UPI0030C7A76C